VASGCHRIGGYGPLHLVMALTVQACASPTKEMALLGPMTRALPFPAMATAMATATVLRHGVPMGMPVSDLHLNIAMRMATRETI
jgi:hypothetical protein